MTCRTPPTFESYVNERLGPRSEAAKMIATLAKDTSISDAIAMTIEALSPSRSRELRQIVDLFEFYCEWVENWEPKGWEIEHSDSQIIVRLPENYEWGRGDRPRSEVIAAGAGVLAVRFDKTIYDPKTSRATAVSFRVAR